MANEKRLIDADALLLVIEEELAHESPFFTTEQNEMIDCGLRIAANDVRHQPTVDAVEVVHGHWTEKIICGGFAEEWGYKCSICGCTVSERSGLGVYQDRNQQLNYCPNCGAKMDGERRTNERKTD